MSPKVDEYSMFLTDCAYLYLMILEEILSEGRNYSDGTLFYEKAKNRDFSGKILAVILNQIPNGCGSNE